MRPVPDIHPAAAKGFGRDARAYERGRPEYPPAAVDLIVDRLGIGPGSTVVDVGAGTGKLTRLLTGRGARVVAVEPVEAMRATLAATSPDAVALDGTAEAIPLSDASADAVTAAQAFHWFRGAEALPEFHRLLRPDGGIGLVWNRRDLEQPLQADMNRLIAPYRGDGPAYTSGRWREAFAGTRLFTELETHHVLFEQELDEGSLVDRVMSTSVLAALPEAENAAVRERVRRVAAGAPRPARLRYITDVYLCRRR